MLEYCVCCQAYAPHWDDSDYAEWQVVLTPEGDYLGVVCVGCNIHEDLAFAGFAHAGDRARPADELAGRRRQATHRRRLSGPPSRRAA